MRSTTVAASLFVIGSVCLAHAQQPPGGATGTQRSDVQAYFLSNEVYFLSNGRSNALAVVTADGIVLLDAMSAGWRQRVLDKLEGLTDMPVTTIVNTHAHEDHAGADAEYPADVQVVMHENSSRRLARGAGPGKAVKAFSDHLPLTVGTRRLDVYYFGRGHTDGDAIVVIPDIKVAYVGDLFEEKALPAIDPTSGGSALALPDTLARAANGITGVDRIVTGHRRWPGAAANSAGARDWPAWQDFREYAQFTRALVDAVTAAWKQGRTAAQVAAELKMPEQYKDYRLDGARAMIDTIFDELKQKR
jgi:glyoxylase-like metal-dependent hydrolase (beta-lactamase superfamily II)